MTANPIPWEPLEDAIHDWAAAALGLTGDAVYFVEPDLDGLVLPPVPAAQIQLLTGPTPLYQPQVVKVPGVTRYRVQVLATGPGDAGVKFYAGDSLTALDVPLAAGIGDAPETTAAALALALSGALPAGYSAAVPLEQLDAVDVVGSEAEPLFALTTSDPAFASSTLARARSTEVESGWSRMTWRVQLRSSTARGYESAAAMLGRLRAAIKRGLVPRLLVIGWTYKGTLAATPTLPAARQEFRAALDFAVEGYANTAYQVTPARQIRCTAA